MTDRKKPGVAFWATVGLLLPVLYVLSLFPIAWLDEREMIPDDSISEKVVSGYCAPVRWARDNGPQWIADSLDWISDSTSP